MDQAAIRLVVLSARGRDKSRARARGPENEGLHRRRLHRPRRRRRGRGYKAKPPPTEWERAERVQINLKRLCVKFSTRVFNRLSHPLQTSCHVQVWKCRRVPKCPQSSLSVTESGGRTLFSRRREQISPLATSSSPLISEGHPSLTRWTPPRLASSFRESPPPPSLSFPLPPLVLTCHLSPINATWGATATSVCRWACRRRASPSFPL